MTRTTYKAIEINDISIDRNNRLIIGRVDTNQTMKIFIDTIQAGGGFVPYYDGPYTVRPLPYDKTVLETKNKKMRDDVTVLKIPYSETVNLSDGYTVYIGGDDYE